MSETPATDILLGTLARSIFLAGCQAATPGMDPQAAEDAWNNYEPPEEDKAEVHRLDALLTAHEETSAEIASLASAIMRRKPARIVSLTDYNALLEHAKRLAGSALTQREKHSGD